MRRRRNRRDEAGISLAFLDVISAAFGAIVLLLVISKPAEPTRERDPGTGQPAVAAELSARLDALADRRARLTEQLSRQRATLAELRQHAAALASRARAAADARLSARASSTIERRLVESRRELRRAIARLESERPDLQDPSVAGIPMDSRYIAFVIDTSGSMQRYAWPLMLSKMRQILAAYPDVRGIQILNDMGDYMFPGYAGRWIPDTPGRRRIILDMLASWTPFSNSSPVEGITRAIRDLSQPGQRMSIYVLGDDYSGNAMQQVMETIERLNPEGPDGKPRVRIHAIGFPVLYLGNAVRPGGIRFATLMRALTQANGGAFVGLKDLQ